MTYPPSPSEGAEPTVVIEALVAQTLDDLEQGHLDLEAALRGVAHAAWSASSTAAFSPTRIRRS